jgi:hypothetical protein
MEIKSISDTTLFFWNLVLFGLLAFTFSIPFWQVNYFNKVINGSTKHIFFGLVYLTVFILLPLWALSWTVTQFVVTQGKIKVIDWFGARQNTYSLPLRKDLKVKRETAPYRFRYFPIDSKYNEFRTLYLTTLEGRKLRIQSRYYKNFDNLNVAIRKACN